MLEDYPVVAEIDVRFRDMDAFAHVDNVEYFQYFELARVAYLKRIGMPIPGPAWHDFGWVIGSTCCRYRAPLTFPDTVRVGARVAAMSEDRVLMEYRVVSTKLEKIAAEGDSLLVAYDFDAGRAMPVREYIRDAILRLEGRELPKVPRGTGRIASPAS
jgi:acyl-CoA thioester hydrolase